MTKKYTDHLTLDEEEEFIEAKKEYEELGSLFRQQSKDLEETRNLLINFKYVLAELLNENKIQELESQGIISSTNLKSCLYDLIKQEENTCLLTRDCLKELSEEKFFIEYDSQGTEITFPKFQVFHFHLRLCLHSEKKLSDIKERFELAKEKYEYLSDIFHWDGAIKAEQQEVFFTGNTEQVYTLG